MNFDDKIRDAVARSGSCLCVGLDPNIRLMPDAVKKTNDTEAGQVRSFLKEVIDVTAEYCAAYKPNLGFFEALGPEGWQIFSDLLDYIPAGKIVIADAKRGDISSTAEHYARAFFEKFDVDAVTLNPLMGFETLTPFLNYSEKGIYVLTLTSNPGAEDFLAKPFGEFPSMAEYIAARLRSVQESSETAIGMVLGATKTEKLKPVSNRFPSSPLLVPGVGKQGGSTDLLMEALQDHEGTVLVNASRSILYAGRGTARWQTAISGKAGEMKQKLSPLASRYV